MKRVHSNSSSHMVAGISSDGGNTSIVSNTRIFKLPRYQIPTSAKKRRAKSAFSPFVKPVILASNLSNYKDKNAAQVYAERRK